MGAFTSSGPGLVCSCVLNPWRVLYCSTVPGDYTMNTCHARCRDIGLMCPKFKKLRSRAKFLKLVCEIMLRLAPGRGRS